MIESRLRESKDECSVCAESPHGRECDCHECADYWHEIAEQSKLAADRANRALVCSCGWVGAFIEHHNSEAYGTTARPGCVMTFRDRRDGSLPKRWTGTEWTQVVALEQEPLRPPCTRDVREASGTGGTR